MIFEIEVVTDYAPGSKTTVEGEKAAEKYLSDVKNKHTAMAERAFKTQSTSEKKWLSKNPNDRRAFLSGYLLGKLTVNIRRI